MSFCLNLEGVCVLVCVCVCVCQSGGWQTVRAGNTVRQMRGSWAQALGSTQA